MRVKFYREKEFKKTEIGEIPREWEVKRLGEISEVKRGASPRPKGDPRYFSSEYTGIHWVKISDLSKYRKSIYLTYTDEFLTEEGRRKSVYIEPNTLIISNSGTVGKPIITQIPACIHDGFLAITNFKNTFQALLYYWFEYNEKNITAYAQRGTQANLNTNIVKNLPIPLPPLSEQKTIAKVLKDFDDLLEVIEEKIKTLQRIKKGLMEVYFTKGVFEHKEFKDTEIGRIPKEWEVRKIKDIFEIYAGGDAKKLNISSVKTERYKYPVFSNAIENNGLFGYADTYQFPANSITVTARGNLGYAIPRYEAFNAIVRLLVLVPKINMDVYFIANFFNEKIRIHDEQTSIKQLTKPKIAQYTIPLPPLEEQKAIAQRLKTIDDQIENLKNQKETLQKIKKKFMDLLLTGKVRIKEIKEEDVDV